MKNILKKLTFLVLRCSGIHVLWHLAFQRHALTILCYHSPEAEIFAKHLAKLRRHFNIISLRDYVTFVRSGKTNQLPPFPLVITLDDGHANNVKLLEAIQTYKVPVTIFLCSGIVGSQRHYWWTKVGSKDELQRLKRMSNEARLAALTQLGVSNKATYPQRQALSRDEILDMAPFIDFQAHTRFHPILPNCTPDQAWEEIAGSKTDLEKDYSFDIFSFAFPNGDYCDRDLKFAQMAGFACAVTLDGGLNESTTDLYRLKRIAVSDDADLNELTVKASGLWAFISTLFRMHRDYGYQQRPLVSKESG